MVKRSLHFNALRASFVGLAAAASLLASGCGVAIRNLRGPLRANVDLAPDLGRVFHVGVAFGPASATRTIGGNPWLTQTEALAAGLTYATAHADDDSSGGDQDGFPIAPFPPADPDVEGMLENVTYRAGADLGFDLPVPNGRYLVYLWAWENWADYARSFDLAFEGTTLDSAAGAATRAADWRRFGPYSVEVADAGLSVALLRNAGNPMISGLEVYASRVAATAAALTVEGPARLVRNGCLPLVVRRVDAQGDAVNPGTVAAVNLAIDGGAALFSDAVCANAIAATTIPANRSARTIYARLPSAGDVTVTASAAGLVSGRAVLAVPSAGLADDFEDDALDPEIWRQWVNGHRAVEQNQRLEFSPAANSAVWPGLVSTARFDLTDSAMVFEIDGLLAPFGNSYNLVYLCEPAGCYEIVFRNGSLDFQKDGVLAHTGAHDPVAQRYVRIAHSTAGDAITLSASPDGSTWTTVHSQARTIGPVFELQLGAGSLVGRPAPGTFAIERFYTE